jgi:hypothetical protein
VALEVETEKRWEPSHASTEERLSCLNSNRGFFDETKVVISSIGATLDQLGPDYLVHLGFKKD